MELRLLMLRLLQTSIFFHPPIHKPITTIFVVAGLVIEKCTGSFLGFWINPTKELNVLSDMMLNKRWVDQRDDDDLSLGSREDNFNLAIVFLDKHIPVFGS